MPRAISEPRALARCAAAGKGCCGPASLRGTPGESDPVCRADKRAFQALLMPRRGGERKIITPAPASSPRGSNSMYSSLIKRRLPRFMSFPRRPQLSGEGDIRAVGVHKVPPPRDRRRPLPSGAKAEHGQGTARRRSEPCVGRTVPGLRSVRFSSVPEQSPESPSSAICSHTARGLLPEPGSLPAARDARRGDRVEREGCIQPTRNHPESEAALLPRGLPGRPHRG